MWHPPLSGPALSHYHDVGNWEAIGSQVEATWLWDWRMQSCWEDYILSFQTRCKAVSGVLGTEADGSRESTLMTLTQRRLTTSTLCVHC